MAPLCHNTLSGMVPSTILGIATNSNAFNETTRDHTHDVNVSIETQGGVIVQLQVMKQCTDGAW